MNSIWCNKVISSNKFNNCVSVDDLYHLKVHRGWELPTTAAIAQVLRGHNSHTDSPPVYICIPSVHGSAIRVCAYALRIYIHTYIHTYVHTYIRTYVHTYIHTYIISIILVYVYDKHDNKIWCTNTYETELIYFTFTLTKDSHIKLAVWMCYYRHINKLLVY
jgi:hypothetical protein